MDLVRRVLWRVPLIALIAGFFYLPLCVRVLLAFGPSTPWVEVVFDLVYLAVVLGAGWLLLLRKLTRRQIFLSALVVTAYSLLLALLLQLGLDGTASIWLDVPLQWTCIFTGLALELGLPVSLIWLVVPLNAAVPLLFALLGRKQ